MSEKTNCTFCRHKRRGLLFWDPLFFRCAVRLKAWGERQPCYALNNGRESCPQYVPKHGEEPPK